jgi:hypothetical protein
VGSEMCIRDSLQLRELAHLPSSPSTWHVLPGGAMVVNIPFLFLAADFLGCGRHQPDMLEHVKFR